MRFLSFADIAKESPGVGAVHQTTALGNADWRRRRKPRVRALLIGGQAPTDDQARGALKWSTPFTIKKTDPERRLVFGWASVAERNGVVVTDKQGEQIEPEELERAAYEFVLNSRRQGDMHERVGVGRLIESMMFTREKQAALGIDLDCTAWWVGFLVDDDGTWEAIKAGRLGEFSIGGAAVPHEV
jgi:hypothetical protein